MNLLPPSFVSSRPFRSLHIAALAGVLCLGAVPAVAQAPGDTIIRVDLPTGRSYPITTVDPITRVSVANPDIADAVVVGERDVVINAKTNGETDIILWITNEPRRHYRIQVRSAPDRQAVLLSVHVAEVRKDALTELGVNMLYRDGNVRAGTGIFNTDNVFDKTTGDITLPSTARFATVLSDFGTKNFLAFVDAQATKGRAKLLAEPNLLAGNRDTATFLEGGEFPVPIAQPGANGTVTLTVQYREFGVRLNFMPEIVSDSMIKLRVNPEVSDLDFVNGVVLSGFRIPALRTRRTSTTVDVKRGESLIISGMFSETRQRTRSGVPILMDIPIIGALFGTSSWQTNETELLILVTPTLVNPNAPPSRSVLNISPDTALPAREAIEKRLPPSPLIREP